eukprot:Nitzschia sp. Nitz4//scaffold89_size161592//126958//128656//NITZ4_002394-RA/size161592-snap-gene-0.180-mRNA-1//-1//CDS//3329559664//2621//frame0
MHSATDTSSHAARSTTGPCPPASENTQGHSGHPLSKSSKQAICRFLLVIVGGLIFVLYLVLRGVITRRSHQDALEPPSGGETSPTSAPVVDFIIPSDYPHQTVLASRKHLKVGQKVYSPSGNYFVSLLSSGDFVLANAWSNEPLWSAGTSQGVRVHLQTDGNLVVRDKDEDALWTTKTHGHRNSVLTVDDGGQLALWWNPSSADVATSAISNVTSQQVWVGGIPRGAYLGPSSYDLPVPTRGIFYYPWFPDTWTVNGAYAHYESDLGFYTSSDPAVVEAHIDSLDYANIDLSVASWWGPDTNLDRARIMLLMDTTLEMKSSVKWTVYHEDERDEQPTVSALREDLDYLKKWFAWHPSWAHMDGKPVIFVYNSDGCDVATRWMEASQGEWYVVLKIMPGFRSCTVQPDGWHQYGVNSGKTLEYDGYAYSMSPGFWRADEEEPRTPRVDPETWCANSKAMAQSNEPWHMIISFNEAGEGTNIENSPHWSTESGYGEYLDCLHQYPTVR